MNSYVLENREIRERDEQQIGNRQKKNYKNRYSFIFYIFIYITSTKNFMTKLAIQWRHRGIEIHFKKFPGCTHSGGPLLLYAP